ncbi:hypothetical protein NWI01_04070 [Nitrobacter winogradskyi]|uniref:Uncharacterized protein n=1 Tax=Nitrobacter winogradskyi TaxID=913 RepID=A0A4Y3W7H5_NITWI|nr:hypothetical protein NWI01_04070 [Nitrobacter winogradskyi]
MTETTPDPCGSPPHNGRPYSVFKRSMSPGLPRGWVAGSREENASDHDDRRANANPVIEIDDIPVAHPDATG